MSEKPEDPTQLAAEIRATRRELADTVSALVEKTDVSRQAQKRIVRLRMRLHDAIAQARRVPGRVAARIRSRNPGEGHE